MAYLDYISPDAHLRWMQYMQLTGFASAWKFQGETEEQRYGPIVAELAQEEAACREELRSQKADIVMRRRLLSDKRKRRQQGIFDTIDQAAQAAELFLAQRQSAKYRRSAGEKPLHSAGGVQSGSNSRWKTVTVPNAQGVGSSGVGVKVGLQGTRYYLGHAGGDYVFRHVGPEWSSEAYRTVSYAPSASSVGVKFVYVGQVPRSTTECLRRLQVVMPQVIKAIISVIGFVNRASPLPASLVRLFEATPVISHMDLVYLSMAWDAAWGSVTDWSDWALMRHMMQRNVFILEYAHLVGTLGFLRQQFEPLEHILIIATECNLTGLIHRDNCRAAEMACVQLYSGRNLHEILIFEDFIIRDIHEFYQQGQFTTDPLHPGRLHELNGRADVLRALDLCRGYWTDDFVQDETNSESADAPPDIVESSSTADGDSLEDESPKQIRSQINKRKRPKRS
ncbi:hypothetical protein HJFPF1_06899 [Paramyrothecium foliicola]|nr:hypothetical protein HJFPF1_06899 [Paramyrothecium foliicola]